MPTKAFAFLLCCGVLLGTRALATIKEQIQKHCDIPGNNLKGVTTPDAESCLAACGQTSDCKGFVYVSGWGRCFLKGKISRQAFVRFYSGHIDRATKAEARSIAAAAHDIDYNGKDMRKIPGLASGEACGQACLSEAGCAAFAYLEGYRDCWLKSTRGTSRGKVFSCGIMDQEQ